MVERLGHVADPRHRAQADNRVALTARMAGVATCFLLAATIIAASASTATAEPSATEFTSSAAEATLKDEILARLPGAQFPSDEGRLCPETYTGTEGQYSVCYAEFQSGGIWYLEGGQAALEGNSIAVTLSTHAHWRRAWVKCALPRGRLGAPGTLTSNYNCGLHQVSDAYLVTIEIYPSIRMHLPVTEAGWQFTESAGFTSLGDFHVKRRGRAYVFTNAVGDSFRYTP
jgi:hypothetical protein